MYSGIACERKYGVTRIKEERRTQLGKDFFPRRKEKTLHIKDTTSLKQRLFSRLIHDMNVNKKYVKKAVYCDRIEREFMIARGLFRKWIPKVLVYNKEALEFYNKNLYNEDISVIEVVSKQVPVLIDISDETTPQLKPPATKYLRKKQSALLKQKKKIKKVRTFPTDPKRQP